MVISICCLFNENNFNERETQLSQQNQNLITTYFINLFNLIITKEKKNKQSLVLFQNKNNLADITQLKKYNLTCLHLNCCKNSKKFPQKTSNNRLRKFW